MINRRVRVVLKRPYYYVHNCTKTDSTYTHVLPANSNKITLFFLKTRQYHVTKYLQNYIISLMRSALCLANVAERSDSSQLDNTFRVDSEISLSYNNIPNR